MIETYRGAVYPWHCDHMGHMNVMWYVGKFDEATWNLFAQLGVTSAYLRENSRAVCVLTAVHMDSKARKSTAFPPQFIARGNELLCDYELAR